MSNLQANDEPLEIDDNKPFANATRRLIAGIDYNPYDVETYQSFLASFARHIVESINPYHLDALTMEENVARLPDMEPPR